MWGIVGDSLWSVLLLTDATKGLVQAGDSDEAVDVLGLSIREVGRFDSGMIRFWEQAHEVHEIVVARYVNKICGG